MPLLLVVGPNVVLGIGAGFGLALVALGLKIWHANRPR